MLVSIEAVARKTDKPGIERVHLYTYKQVESNPDQRYDGVRDENHARDIVKKLAGGIIEEGRPPSDGNGRRLFLVQMKISNTRSDRSTYRVGYRKFDGCPLATIGLMMEIYHILKRECKALRKTLNDKLEAKKKLRQSV